MGELGVWVHNAKCCDFLGSGSVDISFSTKQLEKKFKHAEDFGVVTTKKNPETLKQFQQAVQSHMDDPKTYRHGTYLLVPDSIVYFNSTTNNIAVFSKGGEFISGWKLAPGTPQFDNFIKNGVLR